MLSRLCGFGLAGNQPSLRRLLLSAGLSLLRLRLSGVAGAVLALAVLLLLTAALLRLAVLRLLLRALACISASISLSDRAWSSGSRT